jgi:integrase
MACGKKRPKLSPAGLTVGVWFLEYYNRFRRAKAGEKQQKQNEQFLSEIVTFLGADKLLSKVEPEDVQDLANSLNDAPTKRDKLIGFVRKAFDKAFRMGRIKRDPCQEIEIERHQSKHYPALQFADQRFLLESERNPLCKKIVMMLCCCGARFTELWNALPHIDFKNQLIEIVDEDTRTKKHRRFIPFLRELITPAERDQILSTFTHDGMQTHIRRLLKRTGLKDKGIVIHSFRSTFISCCSFLKIDVKQIQAWAGHSTADMTMNVYAKLLRPDGTSPVLDYLKRLKADQLL